MTYIYLDIDGVLSLGSEIHPKMTKWGYVHRFNQKAVNVFNEILEKTNADYVISSDWKDYYSLDDLKEIMVEYAKIIKPPIDVTITFSNKNLQLLEMFRSKEILEHVDRIKPAKWVAVDDLDLSFWIPGKHFVICTRFYEGIKQTGIKNEIINKLTL
jgi:hypothetical protein